MYYLKAPKIITSVKVKTLNINNSFVKVDSSIVDISNPSININNTNKFDKKHKTSNINNNKDSVDIKKYRINKKSRKNLNINNNNLLSEESINLSLVKNSNYSQNKKKYKVKQKHSINLNNSNEKQFLKNNELDKDIVINSPLTIQELSNKLQIPEAEIITYLFLKGISVTINESIDINIAKDIVSNYGFNCVDSENINQYNLLFEQKMQQNIEIKSKRPPIISIFGHVDHGKTTLLDSILKTELVNKEFGGITQAINGYSINWLYQSEDFPLVFLDTPGHEAFSSMRLRGAKVADIALLVIAADDGLKLQTIEVIELVMKLKLPYIIAINKIDKVDINIDYIKEQLAKYNIVGKEWGGEANIFEVSALKGLNISELLLNICLLANKQNLYADFNQLAQGMILESYLDKKQGIIANVLVQNGTLKKGDFIVAHNIYGRIKNICDNDNLSIEEAKPSSIVKLLGFSKIPEAGSYFFVLDNDKEIKKVINNDSKNYTINNSARLLNQRITLNKSIQYQKNKQLKLVIKTDTQGSLEAIIQALYKIPQSKVQINLIFADTGNISRADIDLALTSNSIIIGFNLDIVPGIAVLVKRYNIVVQNFNIIYDLLNSVQSFMLDLVDPEYEQLVIGNAIVQTVFSVNKGMVAGCLVNQGKLQKDSNIDIYRDDKLVDKSVIDSLKRVKEDVDEVVATNECGVMCNAYNLWQKGDSIKAYTLKTKEKLL
uniref:Translation initiation factor IF-2, chloroplastic n=1 Tax=Pleonosporium borreri TaxID=2575635 RepID=A0A4D6WW43_9FLOR|nr:Translation initiation factor 2 [Pleonosporium borreri]